MVDIRDSVRADNKRTDTEVLRRLLIHVEQKTDLLRRELEFHEMWLTEINDELKVREK